MTSRKQMAAYHSELIILLCSNATVATNGNAEETDNNLFRHASCSLLLDLARLGKPIKPTAVLFPAQMHRSMLRHLCRCYAPSDAL
ncbi:hypothetical protein TNIN_74001 [Trichonephila inaurata madagascariensis]|uniref:Secreted protein n=1 Tax=Trichonephila inaurata madagascariensis TaxID=2747483 RepID=A0A8X6YQW2_9ARAC|nr:hypothetical protein TNIN_74001 [Trichonephila inaurata madagascariensis]